MSRGGRSGTGIGHSHVHTYTDDIYPDDNVIYQGNSFKPPRYYDTQYEKLNPEQMEEIRARRAEAAESASWNNTRARLQVRETVKKAQLSQLKRGLNYEI